MKYLQPAAVFLLMVSIGMSISLPQFIANWRRLTPRSWLKLLAATFLLPPLLALALGSLLPLGPAATAGLFLVAVAPGAPLMTRSVARKGFDMQMAASYQVWGAVLSPLLIPPLVAGGGWLYGREIWIPPLKLLAVIAEQQFLPFAMGMVLLRLAPAWSERLRQPLNLAGNALLTVAIVALLFKLGPALAQVSPWLAAAVLALATGCLVAVPRLSCGQLHSSDVVHQQREPTRGSGVADVWAASPCPARGAGHCGLRTVRRARDDGLCAACRAEAAETDVSDETKWLYELVTTKRLEGDIVWFKLPAKF